MLNKQKLAMRPAMRKPRDLPLKKFAAQLTELNNYLLLFLGSVNAKKMDPEELNDILLRAVPNSWARQAYLQGWDFEGRTYKGTCDMFERIEIAEAIYEGGAPSKIISGKKATVPFLTVRRREEEPPRHPTPIMAALASARENMQDIQAMHRPVQKRHACCMAPGTLPKSVKCYRTTPRSTPHIDH